MVDKSRNKHNHRKGVTFYIIIEICEYKCLYNWWTTMEISVMLPVFLVFGVVNNGENNWNSLWSKNWCGTFE